MKLESIAIDVRGCTVSTKQKVTKKLFDLGVSKDNYNKNHSVILFPENLIGKVGWFYVTDRFRPEGQWGIEWNNCCYKHKEEEDGIFYTANDLLSGKIDNLIVSRIDTSHKKVVNFKVDLSWLKGSAREVISEAIQKKMFEAGCKWASGDTKPILKDSPYLAVYNNEIVYGTTDLGFNEESVQEVSVNNALRGDFWTYSKPEKKEEPKPTGYKVNLSMYKGKEREAISKAIQEEAFKKGFSWMGIDKVAEQMEKAHLYFHLSDGTIYYDTYEDSDYFDNHEFKELFVENILSGALPSVK